MDIRQAWITGPIHNLHLTAHVTKTNQGPSLWVYIRHAKVIEMLPVLPADLMFLHHHYHQPLIH